MFKKIVLSPFLTPVFFFLWEIGWLAFPLFLSYKILLPWAGEGALIDNLTYASYGIAFITLICVHKSFDTKEQRFSYWVFFFLLTCLLLREMGVQHWLTSTDSTAFKIRFFTNPNNPMHEKVISACILTCVAVAVIYLAVKYLKSLISGIFKADTISWTMGTFGFVGIVGKIVDRIPGHYRKITKELMPDEYRVYFLFFEETSEVLLPLFIAFALIQYSILKQNHLRQ